MGMREKREIALGMYLAKLGGEFSYYAYLLRHSRGAHILYVEFHR